MLSDGSPALAHLAQTLPLNLLKITPRGPLTTGSNGGDLRFTEHASHSTSPLFLMKRLRLRDKLSDLQDRVSNLYLWEFSSPKAHRALWDSSSSPCNNNGSVYISASVGHMGFKQLFVLTILLTRRNDRH